MAEPVDTMYDGMKCYGPYTRKDGRQIVILKTPGVSDNRTVSYPKYIVECYLGRYLKEDETVDHIDGNFLNNNIDNLRVIPRSDHVKSHQSEKVDQIRVCPICGCEFVTREYWRKTCGNKRCTGLSAHVLGYNKGNDFKGADKISRDNRYIADKFKLK